MDIIEKYSAALEEYRAKNFDAALKIIDEVKTSAPHWKKSFLLEAYVRREQTEYLKEFSVLEKLLPRFDLSSPDEKSLAADTLSLFGAVNQVLGLTAEAVESFCLSASFENDKKRACEEISNAIFAANCAENFSAADFRTLYDEYKKYLADIEPFAKKFYLHKKIRVGFLSADFQWHVVMAWSWALLSELNKKIFAVYCYSNLKTSDETTDYLRSIADVWRDISGLTDEKAAQLIRDDEIDILFDLSGHTSDNRLRVAAYRPASVQISGIGYMNSTGLDCFDYFLSDVYCAGNASAMNEYFTEKIILLPLSHVCYEPPSKIEPAPAPPCIAKGFVTFGSFNNFGKVTDSILIAWKKILDAVPKSRLILKHKIFNTDDGKNFVSKRLKSFGFDLSRVEMRPYSSAHLREYDDIDIALDTFPYTGGVTTCEALYMGVPVVSLYGSRHGTRFGLSILKNIGLDELAVDSYDKYIERAVALAGDWELLTTLRKNLRAMMKHSPLMDSTNYVKLIGKTFITILNDERKKFFKELVMKLNELYSKANEKYKARKFEEAMKILEEIKRLAPDYRNAYSLAGNIWKERQNYFKQYYEFEKLLPLLKFSSTQEKNFSASTFVCIGDACCELALTKEGYDFYRLAAEFAGHVNVNFAAIDNLFFDLNALENSSVADFRECCNEYKKYMAKLDIQPFPRQFYNHEKIRVGFISADFHQNAMVYWAWSLLTKLDRNRFETYFYSNTDISDKVTEYFRSIADGWHDIFKLEEAKIAKFIHDDEIDILFDLAGHVAGNKLRVAAYRPASVQISGIGYMSSTGLDFFDYFLSDVHCAGNAAAMDKYFTEKIIRLPHSHICYEPHFSKEPTLQPPCLKNGFVTFGSFNKYSKVTDSMLVAWKKILDAVPGSRLIFKHRIFTTADGRDFVSKRLESFSFDLSRVEMRPYSANYLDEYADVDIALDTFPYTGGITTCEALYMGVPVVSLYGDTHGRRFGLSILKNIGLDELAVDSYEAYISRAVMLAGDWDLLTLLRKNLRTMMKRSPLMDSNGYVREIEEVFVKILNDERENFLSR